MNSLRPSVPTRVKVSRFDLIIFRLKTTVPLLYLLPLPRFSEQFSETEKTLRFLEMSPSILPKRFTYPNLEFGVYLTVKFGLLVNSRNPSTFEVLFCFVGLLGIQQ